MDTFWLTATSFVDDLPDLDALVTPPEWHRDAACREHPDVNFFPDRGGSTAEAKAVCASCLVRAECETFAFDTHQRIGIWGGLGHEQRQRKVRGL